MPKPKKTAIKITTNITTKKNDAPLINITNAKTILNEEDGASIPNVATNEPKSTGKTEQVSVLIAVSENNLSKVDKLIEEDLTLVTKILKNGLTPLHLAQSVNMANLLLDNKADINATDENQETPLMHAVQNNNLALERFLIQKKANSFKENRTGETALSMAKSSNYIPIKDVLEQKILSRAQKTQTKFFDYTRSKKPETQELVQKYTDFRTQSLGPDHAIKANNIPGRRLVMGDAGAVAKALYPDNNPMNKSHVHTLITTEAIASRCNFFNAGYKKNQKVNKNWSWEYLDYQLDTDPGSRIKAAEKITISSQYNPISGHLGNFMMRGIGKYGESDIKCVLSAINRLTKKIQSNEEKLADLLLKYIKNGTPITTTSLKENELPTELTKAQRKITLNYLNRICYLAGVKEITRRMHQGVRGNGTAVEELPIGLAYVMSLKLISAGDLRMQQVFDEQAEYGLPTATNISTQRELDIAKEKFSKLTALFYSKNPELHATREGMHQILLSGYGGESDTSGDEYESSDDESVFSIDLS